MAFAKRPSLVPEPHGKPEAVPLKPAPPPAPTSLLDEPEAESPIGLVLRVTGIVVAAFVVLTAVTLWMKPPEWWSGDEDSALHQPHFAQICRASIPT